MKRPLLLDLFCGAGGATKGYQAAGFYVVGVDIDQQPRYVGDEFIQADVLSWLPEMIDSGRIERFDAIHASPPCQAYVQRNKNLKTKHPRLIEPIRQLLEVSRRPFIIENVPGAPLKATVLLCGTMFDLRVLRHRLFEVKGGPLFLTPPCHHWGTVAAGDFAAVYAFGGKGHRRGPGKRDPKSAPGPKWSKAMGIDWMTSNELSQAIPPAYTEYIGRQMIAMIQIEEVTSIEP